MLLYDIILYYTFHLLLHSYFQVNPEITPDIFWEKALETGKTINISKDNKSYELGKILSPVDLIEAVRK